MMFEAFSDGARRAVVIAEQEADRLGHAVAGKGHVLIGVAKTGTPTSGLLASLGATPLALRGHLATRHAPRAADARDRGLSRDAERVLRQARVEAATRRHQQIRTCHVVLALLRDAATHDLLADTGTTTHLLRYVLTPRLDLYEA